MYKLNNITGAIFSLVFVAVTPSWARGSGCCCGSMASLPTATVVAPRGGNETAFPSQRIRRYSYEPSMDTSSTGTYYQPRSFGGGMRSRSSAPPWSLQKTDPGKYRAGK